MIQSQKRNPAACAKQALRAGKPASQNKSCGNRLPLFLLMPSDWRANSEKGSRSSRSSLTQCAIAGIGGGSLQTLRYTSTTCPTVHNSEFYPNYPKPAKLSAAPQAPQEKRRNSEARGCLDSIICISARLSEVSRALVRLSIALENFNRTGMSTSAVHAEALLGCYLRRHYASFARYCTY